MDKITKIQEIDIQQFRGLENIRITFSNRLTLICGKNGTSKSTILGIVAQLFNFEKNHSDDSSLKDFKTIEGKSFKSKFGDHFRLSEKFDTARSMKLSAIVFDAYRKETVKAQLDMTGHNDRRHRMVVRQLDVEGKIEYSRNFTHPVIYLSLRRLLPIANRDYESTKYPYLNNKLNKEEFLTLSNRMLLKVNASKKLSSTTGTIDTSVAHGDNYDEQSVSVGEDNVGQICSALLSFKKLSEELKEEYHGGILLIDEADAGLFPAAQKEFVKILNEYATNYKLQIIMTSHSPLIINEVLELHRKKAENHKVIYLTDSNGKVRSEENRSWEWIKNDLLVETARNRNKTLNPKVKVFFEDLQAAEMFSSLIFRTPYKKFLSIDKKVTLSCSIYKELSKVVEQLDNQFLIILDGDSAGNNAVKKSNQDFMLSLPSDLAPDQLLFWILYEIPKNDSYWDNNIQFTVAVFNKISREIQDKILGKKNITNIEEFKSAIKDYQNDKTKKPKARDLFKNFSKSPELENLLLDRTLNPFNYYFRNHNEEKNKFLVILEKALINVFKKQLNMTTKEVRVMMELNTP
ncbi:AAA family ATPase [Actinobacillus equuli]|uniref:AAA family ATPase n=1 Tax=Actinobacillus equuli TaxID=718 RepID=UPI0024419BDD|nr:AAA family ATPase [Actinobacillus equuli]WGE48092.1 AAA family ATPase [Actinobacillus equuli subsp. equuli]